MGKKKKKSTGGVAVSSAAPPTPALSLEQWQARLREGFDSSTLKAALGNDSALDVLRPLAVDWLRPARGITWPQWRPDCALLDPAGEVLFAAGFEGCASLDLGSGRRRWSLPAGVLGRCGGLALAWGSLHAADRWNNRILRLDPESGRELARIEHSAAGCPLDEPCGLLTVETPSGGAELWAAERGNHRIARFDQQGAFLGWIGSRGLLIEETVQQFCTEHPDNPLFEFPEALYTLPDIDHTPCVFIWDSGNGRFVVLHPDGTPKRRLTPELPQGARFCGQMTVCPPPGGPLLLGIDDVTNTLTAWDHEGGRLASLSLEDLNSQSTRVERLRLLNGAGRLLALSSRGLAFELCGPLADPQGLVRALVQIYPEEPGLRLALAERLEAAGGSLPWEELLVWLDPEATVARLIDPECALHGGALERACGRLSRQAERLEAAGHGDPAAGLRQALHARLETLTAENADCLLHLGRPEADCLERWSAALADLDMALIRTKGRNQKEEMALDDTLEEIRDYPDHTRRCAWRLRALCALSGRPEAAGFRPSLDRLATEAAGLAAERRSLLLGLTGQVTLAGDPLHVQRDELIRMHTAQLAAEARERVAAHLSDCLRAAGWDAPRAAAQEQPGPAAAGAPDAEAALDSFHTLVDNMARYLRSLNEAGGTGGPFGRVVSRQREIFALKASLLLNLLSDNGSTPPVVLELAEQAGRLAGAAWAGAESLRSSGCGREHP